MLPFVSELFGTFALLLTGNGVNASNTFKLGSGNTGWLMIALGWGLGISLGAYVAAESGGHINPAISIAAATVGNLSWYDAAIYSGAQIVGAMLGAFVVFAAYMPYWKTVDGPTQLGIFATGTASKTPLSNLQSEIIGAFVLEFVVCALGQWDLGGFTPFIVGCTVLAIGMSFGGLTGFAINPARDFGPRLLHTFLPFPGKTDSNWSYAWVPIVGPIFGAILAAQLYAVIFLANMGHLIALIICLVIWLCLVVAQVITDLPAVDDCEHKNGEACQFLL